MIFRAPLQSMQHKMRLTWKFNILLQGIILDTQKKKNYNIMRGFLAINSSKYAIFRKKRFSVFEKQKYCLLLVSNTAWCAQSLATFPLFSKA